MSEHMAGISPAPPDLSVTRPPKPRFKRFARIGLIILTVLWILLLIPAVLFALMSPFAFDSGTSPEAYRVFYMMIAFPFVLVGSLIFGWVLYAVRLHLPGFLVALLPVVIFLLFAFLS